MVSLENIESFETYHAYVLNNHDTPYTSELPINNLQQVLLMTSHHFGLPYMIQHLALLYKQLKKKSVIN